MSNDETPPLMIVCAASLSKCGKHMVLGARHWDELMQNARNHIDRSNGVIGMGYAAIVWSGGEQGFIDQYRNYHSRQDAWKIAEKAGQIRRRVGGDTIDGGYLFSENLY